MWHITDPMIRRTRWLAILCLLGFLCPSPADAGRFGEAFGAAVRDPHSWVSAAGALLIGTSGFDDDISRWAVRKKPVFGSRESALRASDNGRTAARFGMLLTTAIYGTVVSLPETALQAVRQGAITSTTSGFTQILKDEVGRTRPDGSNKSSFPSGHANSAFSYAALGRENLEVLRLPAGARIPLATGLDLLAAGTAWSRVEAGKHYPSDVMAGAAVGNFLSVFLNRALRSRRETAQFDLQVQPGAIGLGMRWRR